MKTVLVVLLCVWIVLNVVAFALYGIDKRRAVRGAWRIPEAVLLLAAVFGVVGAALGMVVFRHKTRKLKFRVFVPLIFIVEALVVGFFAYYFLSYAKADSAALSYLSSSSSVSVVALESGGWLFDGPGESAAMVFYPGAKVDTAAYAPLCSSIAARGIDCFLVSVPCHMAIFGIDTADSVISSYSYSTWYVGGHSIGGAAACMYASSSSVVSGVFLCGAYVPCELSVPVCCVYGSSDGVLEMDKLAAGRSYVPSSLYSELVIAGGNHAQFGMYGVQAGDGEASVSCLEQISVAADFAWETLGG